MKRRKGMGKYENAIKLMTERYSKDEPWSLATMNNGRQEVRMVDGYYEDGAVYVTTYSVSNKMKQIEACQDVAVCTFWFVGHGIGENLGWVCDEKNTAVMVKVREAFKEWYYQANNEKDKNCCLLRIRLTDGILSSHGQILHEIDFIKKTATGHDHDPPANITGNLGNYIFCLGEDGASPVYTQAKWELSPANVNAAKAQGAKLALGLSGAPAAGLQLVWQGPGNEPSPLWWQQADILGGSGNIINADAASWDSGTNTLAINLGKALLDYAAFSAQPSLNIIVAYYGSNCVNSLGIASANLQ
jgi:hypothetical protein